jgi:ubiquinone/menaquinone biosynthesis C-methylase UbiE
VGETDSVDLEAVTMRQQATWATGDYAAIGARIVIMSERLVDNADLRAGDRVLDVACGSGNATLAAARAGCRAVGLDYVPSLLERARARAEVEGLPVELVEGDAQALPFVEGEFDAATSVVGVMFAPDQEACASEFLRVTRPGGKIALASWTPDGFIGQMFKVIASHVPPLPGVRPPLQWGSEDRIEELFGSGASEIRNERQTHMFRLPTAQAFVDEMRDYYGPMNKAFEALGDGGGALEADLLALLASLDRRPDEDAIAAPGTYLETVITRA